MMPGLCRLGDALKGTTSGEHSGHVPPHPPVEINGQIYSNVSSNVFINGKPAAFDNSITIEHDSCCGTSYGTNIGMSSNVMINGHPAVRNGDPVNVHDGTGNMIEGSGDVFNN